VDMTQAGSLVHKRAITANTKRPMCLLQRVLVTMHWRCWKRTRSGAQRSAGIIATDGRRVGVDPGRSKQANDEKKIEITKQREVA